MAITQEQILKRGLHAARLLADQEVLDFFSELEKDIKAISFGKAGTDTAERESVYFQLKGISDVLGIMASYANAAEEIVRNSHGPVENDSYDD